MKIIATSSVFNEPLKGVNESYKETLFQEQENASEVFIRQAVVDWWGRYFDSKIALDSEPAQLRANIEAIEIDAKTLWDRAFTGWSNVFYQPYMASTASIVVSPDKTHMAGKVNQDDALNFSQLVSFDVVGSGLGLNDQTYTINEFTLKYRVPHTDNTVFKVSFAGNMEFTNSILNLNTLSLRKFDASAGGFINFEYRGIGSVKNESTKTVFGNTARVNVLDLNNASFTFSFNPDPAKYETPVIKLNVVGQFKEYFGASANRVALEPVQRLNEVNIQLGDLQLNLIDLNIRSTDNDVAIEQQLTSAILASLKRTGIDLGFSLKFGNGLTLDLDSARFIQSKTNSYAYSAKGLVISASIDTQVGTDIVPFQITAKLNASFDLDKGESKAHVTELRLKSEPSGMVKQAFDFLINDIFVPSDRLSEVDTRTIESLVATVNRINQTSFKATHLTYDDDLNLNSLSSVTSATLSGNKNASINGNDKNNVLTGNSGDNMLFGGAGRDQMIGGVGNDTYWVDNRGDRITELAAGGWDSVYASVSFTLGKNLENLYLTTSSAIIGRGNDRDNLIRGTDFDNYLYGGAGNDQLDGRLGNDRLMGGPGEDQFVFSTALNASNNLDTITDFVSGLDRLVLPVDIFPNWTPGQLLVGSDRELNQHRFTSTDRLIFNTDTHTLYFDGDGYGGPNGKPVVVLSGVSQLQARDVSPDLVVDTSLDEIFTITSLIDHIDGGAGTDTVIWGLPSSNYQLRPTAAGWQVADKKALFAADTLVNIEKLQFTDRIINVESKQHASYANLPPELYLFFIMAFNAAPGVTYMNQMAEAYNAGLSVLKIAEIFTTKSQFTNIYPQGLTNQDLATQLGDNIIKSSASAEAKTIFVNDIKAALDVGWTIGQLIHALINLSTRPLTDPTWGNTAKMLNNQIAVAKYYTETLNQSTTDLETLRDVVQSVTSSTDVSTSEAIAQLIGVALLTGGLVA
jgi:hypothetical protein